MGLHSCRYHYLGNLAHYSLAINQFSEQCKFVTIYLYMLRLAAIKKRNLLSKRGEVMENAKFVELYVRVKKTLHSGSLMPVKPRELGGTKVVSFGHMLNVQVFCLY